MLAGYNERGAGAFNAFRTETGSALPWTGINETSGGNLRFGHARDAIASHALVDNPSIVYHVVIYDRGIVIDVPYSVAANDMQARVAVTDAV